MLSQFLSAFALMAMTFAAPISDVCEEPQSSTIPTSVSVPSVAALADDQGGMSLSSDAFSAPPSSPIASSSPTVQSTTPVASPTTPASSLTSTSSVTAPSEPSSSSSPSTYPGPFTGSTVTPEYFVDPVATTYGSCGPEYPVIGMYTAVHPLIYDSFPFVGAAGSVRSICGKKLKVTSSAGVSATVEVRDRFPDNTPRALNDLDLGPMAVSQVFANGATDQVSISGPFRGATWEWL